MSHHPCPPAAAAAASPLPPSLLLSPWTAAAFCLAALGSTVNDSPQPQVPLALGFTNTNSDLRLRQGGREASSQRWDSNSHRVS